MPMDGVLINTLIRELVPIITMGKIRKITQIDKYTIVFSIRCNKDNHNLLISSNSKYSTINLTTNNFESKNSNLMFCTILKKYILNGTIKEINQIDNDRIVKIKIDNRDELGDLRNFELIVELMGKHSNISLIDSTNNKVLDSIKHLSLNNNSYRTLLPGSTYKYPPCEDLKVNPFDFNIDLFRKTLNIVEINENMYSKIFQGVSTPLSKYIFNITENQSIDQKISTITNLFKNLTIKPILYKKNNLYKDFYSFDIDFSDEKENFNNINELLDDFIKTKNKSDDYNNKLLNVKKLIIATIQKIDKKIHIYESSLKESINKDIYKLYGDLISSNIYLLKGGEESLTVENYFSEDLEEITIKLNPKITPSQNIENYYKKFKKLKKSEIMNENNIQEGKKEIEYLNSVLLNLDKAESTFDIDEIRSELFKSGYIKNFKSKNKEIIKSTPYHYITSNGVSIYVGKNNIQNEYLTFKFSKKDFTWLHTKNIPGSHVIIAHTNPNDKILELGGKLAAFYSKASTSSNVPVDYTKVKNVKKMPHSKPGMVIYSTNSTLYVTPPSTVNELNLVLKSDQI